MNVRPDTLPDHPATIPPRTKVVAETSTAVSAAEVEQPSATASELNQAFPAPVSRRAETVAHLRLKRLALFWAQQQGYQSCAFEVSLPNSRYRADLAAYRPSKGRLKVGPAETGQPTLSGRLLFCHTLGNTAVFECKQSRADFLKDSRSARETRTELQELFARRVELERTLRVHYPTLRVSDSLFQDYQSHDLGGLEHETYRAVLARIGRLQKRLFNQTKFDTLVRYRCGNLFYVVAENDIFEPHEVPLHWGLLVRREERLELRAKPVWQPLEDHERLALLHRIASCATRHLNREAGITFESIWQARQTNG
jgi:hypothetical protein